MTLDALLTRCDPQTLPAGSRSGRSRRRSGRRLGRHDPDGLRHERRFGPDGTIRRSRCRRCCRSSPPTATTSTSNCWPWPAGPHGDRLREEAVRTRQPFGGARQHLNHELARRRAIQLQRVHLALLYARMGRTEAALEAGQLRAHRLGPDADRHLLPAHFRARRPRSRRTRRRSSTTWRRSRRCSTAASNAARSSTLGTSSASRRTSACSPPWRTRSTTGGSTN